jgi:nucleotidyltransferase substrate binding protein (TIGR01987 family)
LEESLDSFADKESKTPQQHSKARDSVIKRFEFCFDLLWKCLKDYLEKQCGINIASPKATFRECLAQNCINKEEFDGLLSMLDGRNNTSHRYDEFMAEDIANRAKTHYTLMSTLQGRLKP